MKKDNIKSCVFSFRIDDTELMTYLQSMPAGRRSEYIRQALLFYQNHGAILTEINSGVKELLSRPRTQVTEKLADEVEEVDTEIDDVLGDSIMDILNM